MVLVAFCLLLFTKSSMAKSLILRCCVSMSQTNFCFA